MRPLEHLANEDLILLLKLETKKLNKAVQSKITVEEILKINNRIMEFASELMTRVPGGSKPLDLG